MICPLADFMVGYRDKKQRVAAPQLRFMEERLGILSWTVAAVWGGLNAAAHFAEAFGEDERAQKLSPGSRRRSEPGWRHIYGSQRSTALHGWSMWMNNGSWEVDETVDASLVGLWQFGMYRPDDPKIVSTMQAIRDQLWVKTNVGGVARYTNDQYHQVSQEIYKVPGNPWFICTLWLAEWYALTARSLAI